MSSVKPSAERKRRDNGSGTAVHWDPTRRKFYAQVTLGEGKRRTVRGDTIKDVERARGKLLEAVENGRPTPTEKLSVALYLDEWLETIRVSTLSSKPGGRTKRKRKTHLGYESIVRVHLKPTIGHLSLKTLGARDVQRKLIDAKLAAGASAVRVARMHSCLRAALSHAKRMGLVTDNVAKDVEVDTSDNSRIGEALTPEETVRLLEAARGTRYADLFTFLVTTGLRLGEALALRWDEVDFARQTVRVNKTLEWLPREPWSRVDPKAKSSKRVVPLVPPAIAALRREQDRQLFARRRVGEEIWSEHCLVFSNDRGEAIRERCPQDGWKASLKKAGLDPTKRIHDLRHTAASYLHMLGVPTVTIMAIMGHSTLAMTQRYSHVFDPMLEEAREKLGALYSGMLAER
jgi:integrase